MYTLNNGKLCGERVTVEHAKGTPRTGEYEWGGDYGRTDSHRFVKNFVGIVGCLVVTCQLSIKNIS